jgi:peptidoglycan/LPS O-acetylase OafA/YrhL
MRPDSLATPLYDKSIILTAISAGIRSTLGPEMKSERTPYFNALDGLRACSVLLVIYQHAANKTAAMKRFDGSLGVDIFFVLSGFLITFLLNRERQDTGKVDLSAFYIRRAFRILPIYSVVLATYVLLTFLGHGAKWLEMKAELPYFVTFCNELAPGFHHAPFSATWSLGIEEKFYLVWPFMFFIALARSKWRRALVAVLYLSMLTLLPESYRSGPRSYSGLLVGCFLALALAHPKMVKMRELAARMPAVLPVLLVSACFYLINVNAWFIYLFSWCILLLVGHLILTPSWLSALLSRPVIVWCGKRSYGMYLIHGLLLDTLQNLIHIPAPLGPLVIVFCAFVLSAFGADVLYRFIESPAREYAKKLIAQRGVESAPAALPVQA